VNGIMVWEGYVQWGAESERISGIQPGPQPSMTPEIERRPAASRFLIRSVPPSGSQPGPQPDFRHRPAGNAVVPELADRGHGINAGLTTVVSLVAAVVVLLLAFVLIPQHGTAPLPPVPRPIGLAATAPTSSSVELTWQEPVGPAPDKYQIWIDDRLVGSVGGMQTSYTVRGLRPDTSYRFQISAISGGRHSRRSAYPPMRTTSPPRSDAILAGTWQGKFVVIAATIKPGYPDSSFYKGKEWYYTWQFIPLCASSSPCPMTTLQGKLLGYHTQLVRFTATLSRSGGTYSAVTGTRADPCVSGKVVVPRLGQLKIQITIAMARMEPVISAGLKSRAWTASSLTGQMTLHSPADKANSCSASTIVIKIGASRL
jgi:hypothetical protein